MTWLLRPERKYTPSTLPSAGTTWSHYPKVEHNKRWPVSGKCIEARRRQERRRALLSEELLEQQRAYDRERKARQQRVQSARLQQQEHSSNTRQDVLQTQEQEEPSYASS